MPDKTPQSNSQSGQPPRLSPRLSPAGGWAFAVGTCAGCGSLIVSGGAFLAGAGLWGNLLGLLAGAAVMWMVCRNYAYLMNAFPEAGGAYAYAREIFGYDHGFLVSWFLSLIYFALLWANAASLPFFARFFLGDAFSFGKWYTVFGCDVDPGSILLPAAVLLGVAFLCIRGSRFSVRFMVVLAVLLLAGVAVCTIGALPGKNRLWAPAFAEGSSGWLRVVRIAGLTPMVFVGIGSVSHGMEEASFRYSKAFRILVLALGTVTLLCVCVTLLSGTAYPPRYASWQEYIRDLDHLEGIEAFPAFYAADRFMGSAGTAVLAVSLLAMAIMGMIGAVSALSRLFYALGRDGILPARFGELNSRNVPAKAVMLVAGISMGIPFLGRAVVGWIVHMAVLGATLIYAFVSASAVRLARKRQDRPEFRTGCAGIGGMAVFFVYLLISGLFGDGFLASESFFLFVVWATLGFLCFRLVLHRDEQKRFGHSAIVWAVLLSLVLVVSLVWMNQSVLDVAEKGLVLAEQVPDGAAGLTEAQADLLARQLNLVRASGARSVLVVISVFVLSLVILINSYRLMIRRAKESEAQLSIARYKANTDALTGVKSKHAYADKEAQLDERIASGEAEPFAVAVCDLNGLKQANDTYGHKAGDELIRGACRIICHLFAHSPVFRTGGDEFVVLLTGDDYEKRGEIMAELHRLSVEHITAGGPIISAGLSEYTPSDQNTAAVFDRADAGMYAEKRRLKSLGAPARKLSPAR